MPTITHSCSIEEPTAKGYPVYLKDHILSHHINKKDMENALEQAKNGLCKYNPYPGTTLGKLLFTFLDGTNGTLSEILGRAQAGGSEVKLFLTLPFSLTVLPFELLHNGTQFLLLSDYPKVHLMHTVTERNKYAQAQPSERSLKILFMACCPLSLADNKVLDFEKEEEQIFTATDKYPVDIITEDSGSLSGLYERLYEEGQGGFDIVHITGHAIADQDKGPLFIMESETGEEAAVTPSELWEKLKEFFPKLLFLSGCQTGKSSDEKGKESFAYQMVKFGVPVVLSWTLSVGDKGATLLAAKLYEELAKGIPVEQAIFWARKTVEKTYNPWPLLRIFTDQSPTDKPITNKRGIIHRPERKLTFTYLKNTQMKVLKTGFVGRRRQIQQGKKALRGETGKYGVLISGTAGLGKSCLAGKLIERLKNHALCVIHGKLEASHFITRMENLFEEKRKTEWTALLKADKSFEQRIKDLFGLVFTGFPIIICLDDFEQNLTRKGDLWIVKEEYVSTVGALLSSVPWSKGNGLLMITSRYPFVLEKGGENLAELVLEQIPLSSFRGANLRKKQKQLPAIDISAHAELYMEIGKGNPRLLEWLNEIAIREKKFDFNELKKQVQGMSEEFVNLYLADILAQTEGEDFHKFLQKAAVYRIPVPESVYTCFGDRKFLIIGTSLTLMEKEVAEKRDPVYWVTPVIREKEFDELDEPAQKETHQKAYEWYDKQYGENEHPDAGQSEEAVYHALACRNVRGACRHAVFVGGYKEKMLLYREKVEIQESVAQRITKEVIDVVIKEKDEYAATLLNNIGSAWDDLGDKQKAIEFYNKALAIDLAVFGEKHPDVAIDYNNLGSAWDDLGDNQKAIEFYNKALAIFMHFFGPDHPNTKIVAGNIQSLKE